MTLLSCNQSTEGNIHDNKVESDFIKEATACQCRQAIDTQFTASTLNAASVNESPQVRERQRERESV